MNNFEKNEEVNKQKIESAEKKEIETKELSIEEFAEIVYRNGSMLKSELNTPFIGRKTIIENADHSPKKAQAVFLFNNELYLVYFDVELEEINRNFSVDEYSFTLLPIDISKLEYPTDKNKYSKN